MHNYNKYNRTLGFIELKLNHSDIAVSKTDLEGVILYANPVYTRISGYKTAELVGQNHNISRHPDMPRAIYAHIWSQLKSGKEVYAYVKNLTKDGSFYWVFAYFVPDIGSRGEILGYHSERRAPNPKAIADVTILYEKLKRLEIHDGMEAAVSYLHEVASQRAKSYDSYIFTLQNQE